MTTRRPSIPVLARQIQRALPASIGSFDADAFLASRDSPHADPIAASGTSTLAPTILESEIRDQRSKMDPDPEVMQRVMKSLGVTQAEVDSLRAEGIANSESDFHPTPFPGAPPLPEGADPETYTRPFLPGELDHYLDQYKTWRSAKQAKQTTSSGQSSDHQQTSPFESENVSSGLLNRPRNMCIAANKLGKPCRAYKRYHSDYCSMHDPENAEGIRRARQRGGMRSARRLSPVYLPPDFGDLDFDFLDSCRMQGTMSAVARMLLLGYIPPAHANSVMRFLNGAIRNLAVIKDEEHRRRDDRVLRPNGEQFMDYAEAVGELATIASEVKRRLDDEATRQSNARVAETAARQERAALVRRKYAEPKPSRSPTVGFGPNQIRPLLRGSPRL